MHNLTKTINLTANCEKRYKGNGECSDCGMEQRGLQGREPAAAKSLQSCPTLCNPIDGTTRLPRPWDSPGKNTGVGCHFLLQCMKVKSESEVA